MLELQSMQFERKALSEGFSPVCGIDEAGRGPLAAPVYAAAVILPQHCEGLSVPAAYALIDGNRMPPLSIPGETIVKGDSLSASIAAASILAKVSRDRYMEEMDALYPQYQFAKHKGYGTKLHVELLRQYGPCPIHRRSFLKKILSPEELAQYEHQQ